MPLIWWCCLHPFQQSAREFVSHNLVSYSSLFPSFWFLEVVRRKDIWKAGHIRNLEGIKMSCLKKLKKKKKMSCLLFNFLEQHFLAPGLPERGVLTAFKWRWDLGKWWPFWPYKISPSQASFVLVVSRALRDRRTGKAASFEGEERISAFLSIFLLHC